MKSPSYRDIALRVLFWFCATARIAAQDSPPGPALSHKPVDSPPFSSFGKLSAGRPVPDLTLKAADGSTVRLSELAWGKTVVLSMWRAGYPVSFVDSLERVSRQYSNQGIQFIALVVYSSPEEYAKFLADNKGRFSYPILFDPAGSTPQPDKPYNTMTPEEQRTYMMKAGVHASKEVPFLLAGRPLTGLPSTLVIDSSGRSLGFFVGDPGLPGAPSTALLTLLRKAGASPGPAIVPPRAIASAPPKPAPPAEPGLRPTMLNIGAPAPDFPATDVNGTAINLSDYRGKVVILDFWATWCGPCMRSMPHTQAVAAQYKDQGVVVVACCTTDARASFEKWVQANQSRYPDIMFSHDPLEKSPDRASLKLYGVNGIPQQFIIGRDGTVAARNTGYLPGEVLLESALAQAGIDVDPAILEQAKVDIANRSKPQTQ